MHVVSVQELETSKAELERIARILSEDGLVCFPAGRHYRIAASLYSEDAVLDLVQSKRRALKAPSLVLIPDRKALSGLVGEMPDAARALLKAYWPGPLTILLEPGDEVPPRVVKTLGAKKGGKLGIRIEASEPAASIVQAFGGPLLVSSANISKKVGSSSVAQIKKNFHHSLDVLVEAGDLKDSTPSTVVTFDGDTKVKIQREGLISRDEIRSFLEANGFELLEG